MFYHKPSSAAACRRAVGHSTNYAQKGITLRRLIMSTQISPSNVLTMSSHEILATGYDVVCCIAVLDYWSAIDGKPVMTSAQLLAAIAKQMVDQEIGLIGDTL
ncbi:hypothetical protein AYI74_16680 [Shewanella algae]|nr:hypothetical protein AYI74_16680 [Shewanella algae]